MAPRLFTVAEAERTLPLVRRIVRDLVEEHPAWKRAVAHYELLAGGATAGEGETPELRAAEQAVRRHAERIDGYLAELAQVGCACKDLEAGLVDFHTLRGDRVVCLCWQPGEERIAFWHELDAGFAGRQPVDAAFAPGAEVG